MGIHLFNIHKGRVKNIIATRSLWLGSMILQAYVQYGMLYQAYMREIQQIHMIAQFSMARAPPLISAKISHIICELYRRHKRFTERCDEGTTLDDVFITNTQLNGSHFTAKLSIPWGVDDQDAAATIYSLISLHKPMENNTVAVLAISKRVKALIYDKDSIHAVTDYQSCSRNRNSTFCKTLPSMLLQKDRDCASMLLMAPHQTEKYCDIVYKPRDCHVSPIYTVYGTIYYFLGGCGNILKIYNGSKLINSTLESTLFVLENEFTIAINATTFLQAPEALSVQSQTINNDTLMIASQISIPLVLRNKILANDHQNVSLTWQHKTTQLDDNIQKSINKLKWRKRLWSVI